MKLNIIKQLSLLLIAFLCAGQSHAQAIFQKRIGLFSNNSITGRAIVQNIYGDYYEGGGQFTDFFGNSSANMYISKFSTAGTLLWSQPYFNDSIGNDNCATHGMIALNDGGLLVTGRTISPDSPFDIDLLVARLDSAGMVIWSKIIGDSTITTDTEFGYGIVETVDGNFIISGRSHFPTVNTDYYVKLSPSGSILWQKGFSSSVVSGVCRNMVATADGGFAIGGDKLRIIKFTSSGNQQWRTVPVLASWQAGRGTTICRTNDGGYAVAGIAGNLSGGNVDGPSRDVAIAKYDSMGTLQWLKKYLNPEEDYPSKIIQDANGNFIVSGMLSVILNDTRAMILKTDNAGNSLSVMISPITRSDFLSMNKCADSGYILTGTTRNPPTPIYQYSLTVKTDSALSLPCFTPYTFTDSTYSTTGTHTGSLSLANPPFTTRNFNLLTLGENTAYNYCTILDADDIVFAETSIDLFPNPATNELRIQNANFIIKSAEVYNILGEIVYRASDIQRPIVVSGLDAGIYFVRLQGEKKLAVGKFMVKK